MNYRGTVSFLLAALVSVATGLPLRAQKMEESFQDRLSVAPADSVLTVLVQPAVQVDVLSLENDLRRRNASRAERHRRMVLELRQKSELSQAGLNSYLAKRKRSQVSSYRQFWIANLVAVTATVEEIRQLAARPEVGQVLENRTIYLQAKGKKGTAAAAADALRTAPVPSLSASKVFNWALVKIKARELWARGLTGRGVLVCNIDSGVDGNQPALARKWRGANGATINESWYDPYNNSRFPVDDDYGDTHGTFTMGCMVGQSGADTVGVAPDAQWIAANAFENKGGKPDTDVPTLLACMQWAADPDGDPSTIDDVPDILNLSFAVPAESGCQKDYWTDVENLQNLGVAVFIAAGNTTNYANPSKVGSPANNPEFFAVGAVDSVYVRGGFSTVGPSICDNKTIKPDVVAPGVAVQSTLGVLKGSGYGFDSGTSFSTPLVAGIGALLHEYNPDLTPRQITEAIRNSATELGAAGPDTVFGYGFVNAQAALNALSITAPPTRPVYSILSITVSSGGDSQADPGESASLTLKVINNGLSAASVNATLIPMSSDVTPVQTQSSYGNLATGQSGVNTTAFQVRFSPVIPRGVLRTFKLALSSGGTADTVSFVLAVGGEPQPPIQSFAMHDINQAGLSLTNYGVIGTDDTAGGGFIFPYGQAGARDQLFQGALLIATGPQNISDADYSETQTASDSYDFNHDFKVAPDGNIIKATPGLYSDQEIRGAYSDSLVPAATRLGVIVSQCSYAWSATADKNYEIVEYNLAGPAGRNLDGVYVAQHIDWDVGTSGSDDKAGYDAANRLAYQFDDASGVWVGHALLTQGAAGFQAFNYSRDIANGFTTAEKFGAMTGGARDTVITQAGDWSELLSAGPVYLKPGRSVPVAFAVIGGASLQELRTQATAARARYASIAQARGIDLEPPVISQFTSPDSEVGLTNLVVRAVASDNSQLDQTSVFWRVLPAAIYSKSTMAPDSSGALVGTIPVQPVGARLEFYLRALDAMGNQAYLPENAPGSVFSLHMVDLEEPSISLASAEPDTAAGMSRFLISARVSDNNLYQVYAVYSAGDSLMKDTLALAREGQTDTYSAPLSGIALGTEVRYYIVALDLGGHRTVSPADAPAAYLSFRFTPLVAGDGNLDGRVDIFDLLTLLRVLGGSMEPSRQQIQGLDLDANGKIDIFDLLGLLRLLSSTH